MSLIISGATIIDGVEEKPVEGRSIWIENGRIKAIDKPEALGSRPDGKVIDARGKFVIPGLMNANVHLLCDIRLENLARHWGHYEDLITEAAQVALKNGLTTVFDTWGPRRFLQAVQQRVNSGETPGSRFFCAGNIIGLDGPYSPDFWSKTLEVASSALVKRINAIWVENVGRHLMWLPHEQVAQHVRAYISKGIDFVKFASNDHTATPFLAFSPRTQAVIVEEAHRAGLTAQAHATSVEGLRIALEAGCDLIQHPNITGPIPIPEDTLELLASSKKGAVVFPFTQRRLDWIMENVAEEGWSMWEASDINARNLIRSGARLLMANDGAVFAPERASDPNKNWTTPGDDNLIDLATGHFAWLKAMEEKGCAPIEMLRAATRNIAVAYGKDKDLGTLEPGKIADMVILDSNPLQSAENYRSIHMILKDGTVVDREALPLKPVLTLPLEHAEEEASYISFFRSGRYPMCATCKHD